MTIDDDGLCPYRIMDQEKPTFPLARYHYRSDLTFYYVYGNTPPHDLLENCAGERDPKNIRSFLSFSGHSKERKFVCVFNFYKRADKT